MLAQNESDASLDRSLRTNSIKIILSAMWFTDTAGVDNILVEYRPAKADMTTPAYKFYSSIYRLCYSFHSSLEEIVDFVDTLRPKRLFSIALPDSTSEQQINEYFYDSNGQFVGFHNCSASAGGHQMKRSTSFGTGSKTAAESPLKKRVSTDTTLVLRKRKPFEFGNNGSTSDTSSNCSSSSSHSENELVFGGDSDDENNDGKRKKIKS